jgi:hypothetical protein
VKYCRGIERLPGSRYEVPLIAEGSLDAAFNRRESSEVEPSLEVCRKAFGFAFLNVSLSLLTARRLPFPSF